MGNLELYYELRGYKEEPSTANLFIRRLSPLNFTHMEYHIWAETLHYLFFIINDKLDSESLVGM